MLDGLACLMVLHGLLKVTGVQRNPGIVGGVARHLVPASTPHGLTMVQLLALSDDKESSS